MRTAFLFLIATLLLGCGGDQLPASLDATVSDVRDASETSIGDAPADAFVDAGVLLDTNPLPLDSH